MDEESILTKVFITREDRVENSQDRKALLEDTPGEQRIAGLSSEPNWLSSERS
jgi:hypothetical protein